MTWLASWPEDNVPHTKAFDREADAVNFVAPRLTVGKQAVVFWSENLERLER